MRRGVWLLMLGACADPLEPDGTGTYVLNEAYSLVIESDSGPGACDWLSEQDWELSEEEAPGYCVALASIDGPAPDPRTLVYLDATGESPLGTYVKGGVEVEDAGEPVAEVLIYNVGSSERALTVDLVWGNVEDPNTWELATVNIYPVRWSL